MLQTKRRHMNWQHDFTTERLYSGKGVRFSIGIGSVATANWYPMPGVRLRSCLLNGESKDIDDVRC